MASEDGEKPEVAAVEQLAVTTRLNDWIIPTLRLLAFFATLAATLVMALNRQKKTFVATIGTTPIQVTLTAKFQHTPAFVFFVIANGNASLHNLLILIVNFMGHKFDYKGLRPFAIAVLDMINVAFVSGGASAAAFMGQLGRDGNSHARWNKICDKFGSFCDRGSGAMLASFIGLGLMIIINIISIVKLRNHKLVKSSIVP
ncbi:CASP-like protein 1B2 [Olea europaea var. sylvestris]|uniref:CASP-like protein 1B2 n=1 Tax=Olea europaea var. sylvestris TaxID=158386 RepID=UPI000C1D8714|nr:CASP-like protein 1B2 [Olea europaea var. sylvestris]